MNDISTGGITGYACGGTNEPCDVRGLRYFRPNNNVTRGQAAKMIVMGNSMSGDPATMPQGANYTFADIPNPSIAPGTAFWLEAEVQNNRNIANGYGCGTNQFEPCDAQNHRYFRVGANVTRGQALKMVANSWFPGKNLLSNINGEICYVPPGP